MQGIVTLAWWTRSTAAAMNPGASGVGHMPRRGLRRSRGFAPNIGRLACVMRCTAHAKYQAALLDPAALSVLAVTLQLPAPSCPPPASVPAMSARFRGHSQARVLLLLPRRPLVCRQRQKKP